MQSPMSTRRPSRFNEIVQQNPVLSPSPIRRPSRFNDIVKNATQTPIDFSETKEWNWTFFHIILLCLQLVVTGVIIYRLETENPTETLKCVQNTTTFTVLEIANVVLICLHFVLLYMSYSKY